MENNNQDNVHMQALGREANLALPLKFAILIDLN